MASYDPYYGYVSLLISGNGDNDSQAIIDEKSHTVVVNGNACIKTATKKFGSGSIYFDGSGDNLQLSTSTDFGFGTGDFTIDFWAYPTRNVGVEMFIDVRTSNSGQPLVISKSAAGELRCYDGISVYLGGVFALNSWNYVAWSRSGTDNSLYLNGDRVINFSNGFNAGSTKPITIGSNVLTSLEMYQGYLDDIRITKYARFSGAKCRIPAFEASTSNVAPDLTLTSITPHKGPTSGGTLVTLAGSGFTDFTTCTIDGNSLTAIATVSDAELTGNTPPGTVGLKDVIVTNP